MHTAHTRHTALSCFDTHEASSLLSSDVCFDDFSQVVLDKLQSLFAPRLNFISLLSHKISRHTNFKRR